MAVTLKTIWQSALEALCQRVGESRFRLWFQNIELVEFSEGVATLGVPSLFVRDWLEDHYREVLVEVLSEEMEEPVSVTFRIDARLFQASRRREAEARTEVLEELTRRSGLVHRAENHDQYQNIEVSSTASGHRHQHGDKENNR